MSKELVNPFVNLELHTIVAIKPYQLNNDLYIHLKNNLKLQSENKCNSIGYICKINEIIKYDDGYIEPEDFSGDILFNVSFTANICIPLKNTYIVTRIESIHKQLIIANNGPIKCIIKTNDYNHDKFSMSTQSKLIYKSTNKTIVSDDYIIVHIRSHKSYVGEDKIGIMGFIEDIPTDNDIKNYYYTKHLEEDEITINQVEYSMLNEDDNEN